MSFDLFWKQKLESCCSRVNGYWKRLGRSKVTLETLVSSKVLWKIRKIIWNLQPSSSSSAFFSFFFFLLKLLTIISSFFLYIFFLPCLLLTHGFYVQLFTLCLLAFDNFSVYVLIFLPTLFEDFYIYCPQEIRDYYISHCVLVSL